MLFLSFTKNSDNSFITVHTFARDLKWIPHVHILLADGYIDHTDVFHSMKFISYTALRKRWMTTLLYALKDAIKDRQAPIYKMS